MGGAPTVPADQRNKSRADAQSIESLGAAISSGKNSVPPAIAGPAPLRKTASHLTLDERNTMKAKLIPELPASMQAVEQAEHAAPYGRMGEGGGEAPIFTEDGVTRRPLTHQDSHYNAKYDSHADFRHEAGISMRSFFGGTMTTPFGSGRLTGLLGMPSSPWDFNKKKNITKLGEQHGFGPTGPQDDGARGHDSSKPKHDDDELDAQDHDLNRLYDAKDPGVEDPLLVTHMSWKETQKPEEEENSFFNLFGKKKKESLTERKEREGKERMSSMRLDGASPPTGHSGDPREGERAFGASSGLGGRTASGGVLGIPAGSSSGEGDGDDNGSIGGGSIVGELPSLTINTQLGNSYAVLQHPQDQNPEQRLDRLFADAVDVNAEDSVDEYGIRMVHNYSTAPTPKSEWGGTIGNSFKNPGQSFGTKDLSVHEHPYEPKKGYRGGATWVDANEKKRAERKLLAEGGSVGSLQKKKSIEYASAAVTAAELDALPREVGTMYFQKKTARDRLRTRLMSRYGGEAAEGVAHQLGEHDHTSTLRPSKDRMEEGFIRPIDRQAEAIMGVYQSDLEHSWGV